LLSFNFVFLFSQAVLDGVEGFGFFFCVIFSLVWVFVWCVFVFFFGLCPLFLFFGVCVVVFLVLFFCSLGVLFCVFGKSVFLGLYVFERLCFCSFLLKVA